MTYRTESMLAYGGLGGGYDDSMAPTRLESKKTPNAVNVEFDRASVAAAYGSIKANNQAAPRSAIRTKVDFSPLYFDVDKAVPVRGYGYLPWHETTDVLGGQMLSEGDFFAGTETYHNRRGRSGQVDVSFKIPDEERLYEAPTLGAGAPTANDPAWTPPHGFDEALDECFLILQKGGDRTAPMSWAIGVVNVGEGVGLTGLPAKRPSNYALVFMWLDAPQWGRVRPDSMGYNLTTSQSPVSGGAAQVCTQAYRAVLIHRYVEPGRSYNVSLQLELDTGDPGGVAKNTAWVDDGAFRVYVAEEGGLATGGHSIVDSGAGPTLTGLEVIRGPQDSAEYLVKYGVRFWGKDAHFLGLGMRFLPWKLTGFLPFGSDLTPLKNGGFSMVDRSTATVAGLYGGVHTLTVQHTLGNAYVEANHRGLVNGNTNGGLSPYPPGNWNGLGGPAAAITFNAEALRGYRLITTGDFAAGSPDPMRGAVLSILSYSEVGGTSFRLEVDGGAALETWTPEPVLVQAFRWHQRELVIGEVRFWNAARDYADSDLYVRNRRLLSIGRYIDVDDVHEPDLPTLTALWHLDDAGGTVLRESVVGGTRSGHLCPFGLGQVEGGTRGSKLQFLSGEGEGVVWNLAENPIFQREVRRLLAGGRMGFALEFTGIFTEAFYGIGELLGSLPDDSATAPVAGERPRYVPDLLSLDVANAPGSGLRTPPKPLLTLTHRGYYPAATAAFLQPMALTAEISHRSDQEAEQPMTPPALMPVYLDAGANSVFRYGLDAPWVGRSVTVQLGIQSTGAKDEYDVYLAMSPKDAFNPEDGDPSDAEFAYWTDGGTTYEASYVPYFSTAHMRISPKDLLRLAFSIGRWDCGSTNGYAELQPRMLVDEVRFFATAAPGALPAASGGFLPDRDGKLEGPAALPPRLLELDDILQEVGPSLSKVDVTDGSALVQPAGGTNFFDANPWETIRAVLDTYLYVPGDEHKVRSAQTLGAEQEELYLIGSVASGGASLTLKHAFGHGSRRGASAYSLRLAAYSAFEDDIRDKAPSLGVGRPFEPGVTTIDDVVLSEPLWSNTAPMSADGRLRFYSPLFARGLREVLPSWTRGLSAPGGKGNPILGMRGFRDKVYAAARGSLFEVDDRWREVDHGENRRYGVAFRARDIDGGVTAGLQCDRLEYGSQFDRVQFVSDPDDAYVYVYTVRGEIFACDEFQTALWWGDPASNPALEAGSAGHLVGTIMRLNRGRPELIFGSSATFDGAGGRPEKGLFIARGNLAVPVGERFVVRWYVSTRAGGTIVEIPHLKVNGRTVPVTVNAVDDDASITAATDWLRTSTLVTITGGTALVGIARDSFRAAEKDELFAQGALSGSFIKPQRLQGYLHSWNGIISELSVMRHVPWSGDEPANFNPDKIDDVTDLVATEFYLLGAKAAGIGHAIEEGATTQAGPIKSHPFVSLYHELGDSDAPVSFAEYGSQLIVTNGGRPAYIQGDRAGVAGVLAPTTAPRFEVERLPLWVPNVRDKVAASEDNDPVDGAVAGAADQVNHFSVHGNNYLLAAPDSTGLTEIAWSQGAYGGFKCYLRLRNTAGRVPLMGRRDSMQSGPLALDVVDGKLRVGWYDLFQKREVYVETSEPVVFPGYWNEIYLRKRWPQEDAVEGNWVNQFWTDARMRRITIAASHTFVLGETVTGGTSGTLIVSKVYPAAATTTLEGVLTGAAELVGNLTGSSSGATGVAPATTIHPMNDMLVLRRFRKSAATGDERPYDLSTTTERMAISFTADQLPIGSGFTASGAVLPPGQVFNGFTNGNITANYSTFTTDMLGMYWQWGTGAPAAFVGKLYRIVTVVSSTQITVRDVNTNALPNLSGIVNQPGMIFTGVALVKSEGFDESRRPDDGGYDLQLFGHPAAINPTSGVEPFDGEFDSFGYTVIHNTTGEDARVFEDVDSSVGSGNDAAEVGTDQAGAFIYAAAGEPGELRFDDWATGPDVGTWLCVHGREYGSGAGENSSTQPNSDGTGSVPRVAKDGPDPAPSANAPDLEFRYLQAVSTFAGARWARVAFFDPLQNAASNPGPALLIEPAGEDRQNPSGQVRYKLTGLPGPVQDGPLELLVALSVAGGTAVDVFQVAVVPRGTAEVVIDSPDAVISTGPALLFSNFPPPRCSIVAAAQARMFYGALESQLDGVQFSAAGAPVSLDISLTTGFFRLTNGKGERITMLHDLDGLLVVAKRGALASYQIDAAGTPVASPVSDGVGCAALQSAQELDNRLYFLSDRGLQYVARRGVTNLGEPLWIGDPIETYFAEVLDRRRIDRISAAINRARNQYVFVAQGDGDLHQMRRVAMELGRDGDPIYSLFEEPHLTALASVQRPGGGVDFLMGGTEEGYAVFLDRDDTELHLMGSESLLWGEALNRTDAVGNVRGVIAKETEALDTLLDGHRGQTIRWLDSNGFERSALIYGSVLNFQLFNEPIDPNDVPEEETFISFGAIKRRWETPWLSLGTPELHKELTFIDLVFEPQVDGALVAELYVDLDGDTPVASLSINLSEREHTFQTAGAAYARWYKLVLRDADVSLTPRFELTNVVWRITEADQEG